MCALALVVSGHTSAGGVLVLKSQTTSEAAGPNNQALDGFRQAYSGESRVVEGRRDFQRFVASDRPSLIVAAGPQAAEIARDSARNIPLVFMMVPNPPGLGLTGNNICGVALDVGGDAQLRLFKELLPHLKVLGVIYNPDKDSDIVQEAMSASTRLGIQVLATPADSAEDVRTAFTLIGTPEVIDALWLLPDRSSAVLSASVLLRETKDRALPFLVPSEGHVRLGALAGTVPDYYDIGRQCGELVNQLLQGRTKLASVGTVRPRKPIFFVNTATAGEIRVNIPGNVRASARLVP